MDIIKKNMIFSGLIFIFVGIIIGYTYEYYSQKNKLSTIDDQIKSGTYNTGDTGSDSVDTIRTKINTASYIIATLVGVSILLFILYYLGVFGYKPSATTPSHFKYSDEISYIWFFALWAMTIFLIMGEGYKIINCNKEKKDCPANQTFSNLKKENIVQLIINKHDTNSDDTYKINVKSLIPGTTDFSFCPIAYECDSDRANLISIINSLCDGSS